MGEGEKNLKNGETGIENPISEYRAVSLQTIDISYNYVYKPNVMPKHIIYYIKYWRYQ